MKPWWGKNDHVRRMVKARHRRVYFVEAPALRLIKIGISIELPVRFAMLNSGSPVPLVLLGSLPGSRFDEEALHFRFATVRVRGEWFRSDSVRPFMRGLLAMNAREQRRTLNAIFRRSRAS